MNEINVILVLALFAILVICIAISFIKELFNIWETKKIIEKCYDNEYEDDFDFIIDILPHVVNDKRILENIFECLNQINLNSQIEFLRQENKELKEMLDLNISASVEVIERQQDDELKVIDNEKL